MARKTTESKTKQYRVTSPVENFCGIGASGVQFAYGKAIINEGWVLDWYREHGFKIEPIDPQDDRQDDPQNAEA